MTTGYFRLPMNGQDIGLKFGALSAQIFSEQIEKGKRLMVGEFLNELGISYVLWAGYINHCEVKQTDPLLTFEDFCNYVESANDSEEISKTITDAISVWVESRTIKKAIEAGDTKKKKAVRH